MNMNMDKRQILTDVKTSLNSVLQKVKLIFARETI